MPNTRVEPYIRIANSLDDIGLHSHADNVEALMRVASAMESGIPLFHNREEHSEYLNLIKDAKAYIESQVPSNQRQASDRTFVLGELDRYIELWSFMLDHDEHMRVARRNLPFSLRFAATTQSELTPSQLALLDTLQPVLRHIWFNGIREAFGADNKFVIEPRVLNPVGAKLKDAHEQYALDKDDVSMRKFTKEMRHGIARAKHLAELDGERNKSQILLAQASGLQALQTPEARSVTELLVSKQLEPIVQKTNAPESRQQLAVDASAVINWFLEPIANTKSNLKQIEKKAQMLGMPSDQTLPDGFFEVPAHASGTEGVRWFDDNEIKYLKSRSNEEASVLNMVPDDAVSINSTEGPGLEDQSSEEPVIEEPTPQAPVIEDELAENNPVVEEPTEQTPVEPTVEAPIDAPIDAPIEDATTPIAPEQESAEEVPVTQDVEQPTQDTDEDSVSQVDPGGDAMVSQIADMICETVLGKTGEPEETQDFFKQVADAIIGTEDNDLIRQTVAVAIAYPEDPSSETIESIMRLDDSQIEKLRLLVFQGMEDSNAEEQPKHAPGIEEQSPSPIIPNDSDTDVDDSDISEEPAHPDGDYEYGGIRDVESVGRRKRLMKWLAGLGVGAATIWSIINHLVPGGAASEAVAPEYRPSEYSQPEITQVPNQPVQVKQPDVKTEWKPSTKPSWNETPQFNPAPAPAKPQMPQVAPVETPKSTPTTSPYQRMWDPND